MGYLIAVDPGDVYTGVAFFERDSEETHGWRCVDAQELSADEFADALAESIIDGDVETVVFERFRLYADKSVEQTGSEFKTAQLIGVIKWLVRVHNQHVERHALAEERGLLTSCEQPGGVCHNPPRRPAAIDIHGQMADIKKPTRAILKRKGIKSVAKPIATELYSGRDHIVDAELHGWKRILDPRD